MVRYFFYNLRTRQVHEVTSGTWDYCFTPDVKFARVFTEDNNRVQFEVEPHLITTGTIIEFMKFIR